MVIRTATGVGVAAARALGADTGADGGAGGAGGGLAGTTGGGGTTVAL